MRSFSRQRRRCQSWTKYVWKDLDTDLSKKHLAWHRQPCCWKNTSSKIQRTRIRNKSALRCFNATKVYLHQREAMRRRCWMSMLRWCASTDWTPKMTLVCQYRLNSEDDALRYADLWWRLNGMIVRVTCACVLSTRRHPAHMSSGVGAESSSEWDTSSAVTHGLSWIEDRQIASHAKRTGYETQDMNKADALTTYISYVTRENK